MPHLAALVAALLASPALAEPATVVSIDGWRFHAGDDPGWAATELDDAAWEAAAMPGPWPSHAEQGGFAWLRTTVPVARGVEQHLALGHVRDAYEVFVDGTRIGGLGTLPPEWSVSTPQPLSFAIPAEASRDGEVVVALRVWRHPSVASARPAQAMLTRGPWLVGPAPLVDELVALARYRERAEGLPRFVLFVLFTAVGGYHLMLFARIPRYREYLWFGVTAIGLGFNVLVVSGWTVEVVPGLDPTLRVLSAAFHLQIAGFALFLWNLVERPMGPVVRGLVAIHLVLSATMLLLGGYPASILTSFWRGLLLVPLAMAALGVTADAARRGNTDARIVLVGGLPLFGAAVFDRLAGIDSLVGGLTALGFGLFVLTIAGMLASRFARLYAELDQRNAVLARINAATSRFVPFPFLDMLGRSSVVEVELGDQVQREMTILFTDIRAFTSLSEGMSASETFAFINAYLSRMEPAVGANGGFIDKYIGDAIMALFPHRPDDAVRAAIAMMRALEAFNAERAARGQPPIGTGIGINTGPMMLGTVGGEGRMDTTVISDAVNLASRTEGATKRYGAHILLTASTVEGLESPEDFTLRRIDRIAVKGKSQPVTVYEVLDTWPDAVRARRSAGSDRLGAALDAMATGDLAAARAALVTLVEQDADDPVPALHLHTLDQVIASGASDGWDGVAQLTEK